MRVKDLLEALKDVDPNREVVLSRDPEGNGFSPWSGDIWSCRYRYGETGLEELTDELREKGYSDEDVMDGGVPAVTLWPV